MADTREYRDLVTNGWKIECVHRNYPLAERNPEWKRKVRIIKRAVRSTVKSALQRSEATI
jgi:hypothetical protein